MSGAFEHGDELGPFHAAALPLPGQEYPEEVAGRGGEPVCNVAVPPLPEVRLKDNGLVSLFCRNGHGIVMRQSLRITLLP